MLFDLISNIDFLRKDLKYFVQALCYQNYLKHVIESS